VTPAPPGMSLGEPVEDPGRAPAGHRAGPNHARTTGRGWRPFVVGILVVAVAAIVALLLAQSAGAIHLPVLGVTPAGR
jgi:hypothetical protein